MGMPARVLTQADVEMTLETLKEARDRLKLTQQMLAFRASAASGQSISVQTIHRIETDAVSPTYATRALLARALGVAVEEIAWPEKARGKGEAQS